MNVTPLPEIERRPRRVALGSFDGVHLGHREVIRGADTVLTFDPHPASVVRPGGGPKLITTLERKAQLVARLGVRELVVVPFDTEWAARTAAEFVDQVLVGALQATQVSVGENFRFGHRAQGDPGLLQADPRFETRVVELVEVDGEIVSSSQIRALLRSGAVEQAAKLLAGPFALAGEVVHGDERGRELGYPTANIVPDPRYVTPGHGVYACWAGVADAEGRWSRRPAAVNVGVRPQFETAGAELVEAYLLDWKGDLYGQRLEVAFVGRLRGEQRFGSVDALVEQMGRDVADARRVLEAKAEAAA